MTDLFDAAAAIAARNAGQTAVEISSLLWGDEWVQKARAWAVKYARENGKVCSDDIHRHCPMPATLHPNAMGAVFRTDELVPVAMKKTTRVKGHARRILVYKAA